MQTELIGLGGVIIEHVIDCEAGGNFDADPIRTPDATQGLDHFQREASPSLQRATVGVGAAVRRGDLKLFW